MPKYSQIARGTRAIKTIDFPFSEGEQPCKVGLRVLSSGELGGVLEQALAYATSKGVKDPKSGDSIYDLGLMSYTIERCYVDLDDTSKPFFDGGVDQILKELSRDTTVLLFELYQHYSDEVSPQLKNLKAEELFEHMVALAVAPDEAPFLSMRPGLRWICTHTMAKAWLTSQMLKWDSTSGSDSAGTSDTAKS